MSNIREKATMWAAALDNTDDLTAGWVARQIRDWLRTTPADFVAIPRKEIEWARPYVEQRVLPSEDFWTWAERLLLACAGSEPSAWHDKPKDAILRALQIAQKSLQNDHKTFTAREIVGKAIVAREAELAAGVCQKRTSRADKCREELAALREAHEYFKDHIGGWGYVLKDILLSDIAEREMESQAH